MSQTADNLSLATLPENCRKRALSNASLSSTRPEPKSIIEIRISNESCSSNKRANLEQQQPQQQAQADDATSGRGNMEQQQPKLQESNAIELTAEEQQLDQEYRANCAIFLQHLPCFKLQESKTPKCRECRRRHGLQAATLSSGNISSNNNNSSNSNNNDIYCRFYEFRRLQYNEAGELSVAGFPNPYQEPTSDDYSIWQPDGKTAPTAGYMDIQVCRYILLHAGDQFCYLWRQEAEALKLHENPDGTIAWKKAVQGIREICDVCDTTLFNYHWTCNKCGFGVCIDCFKDRKEGLQVKRRIETQRGNDEHQWFLCTDEKQQKHSLSELMLTQIIAGDALNVLGRLLHEVRMLWQVPQVCGCLLSKQQVKDEELTQFIEDMIKESQLKQQTSASSLATAQTLQQQQRLELLHAKKLEFARQHGIDYVPGRVWTKETLGKDPITSAFDNFKHINFLRKGLAGLRRFLPPRAMTLAHSTQLAPGVPHEWLCDGKLLRLTDPMHPDNRVLYQEVWKCGQPVMISEVARSLNLDLWHPQAFCCDFGDKPNDLINCLNGNLVPNQPMRHFWEGFQCMHKRLLDANGKPMLLKLKDWPPGDDFAEILPTRFADLMRGLPMPEYTLRTGNLNIASCLPKMFVPPDLGPKMYNAYGSALHPDKGTTNLHLDISDAVNIMVYVGIPTDEDSKPQLAATQRAIALGGCDYITRARCQSPDVLPGALWHIFPARDADKIRDLLNRVTLEKGFRLEPDHDPIHDQNWYLDDKLRARLFKEYGVEGYPIVQCLGDAVFIPAGAPHQVQNLHNCIKVAEDFVSPENITHCYHLTHEFRRLSHSHTNHEDKLQIKNIIYHAIKDCCTILTRALEERIDQETVKLQGGV
ncbi:lysine-specific demethylase 3A-A [Drosophila sulfurigaster albostrigata]|uniref:lysine-specific demethylase 3A-A n=1 Tax=Drosophila sulfurigaster albostrigata TaxID=89887 RepID=UPI002D21A094|nr:lysine-specific demethylase 3A-A [Drosophila sulfurigaster albostrigata]